MKKNPFFRLLFLLYLISIFHSAKGQTTYGKYIKSIGKTYTYKKGFAPQTIETKKRETDLLSQAALGRLFSQKLAFYLSGDNSVALFDNYLAFNPTKKDLTVGYNKGWSSNKNDEEKKALTSIALTTNVADNTSSVFKNGDWDNELSLSLRHSFFMNRGKILYTIEQRDSLHKHFNDEIKLIQALKDQEEKDFEQLLLRTYNSFDPVYKDKLAKFQKKANNKFLEDATALEVELSEDKYNQLYTNWFSLMLDIPISSKKITVTNVEYSYRPIEIGLQYNLLYENKCITIFGSFGASYLANNNTSVYETFKDLVNSDQQTYLGNKLSLSYNKDDEIFDGSFQKFSTFRFKPQFYLSSNGLIKKLEDSKSIKNISLNLFGEFKSGKYAVANAGFGLLFSLRIKDDKPMNTELKFNWNDFNDKFLPNIAGRQKLQISLGFSLPFNSIIF